MTAKKYVLCLVSTLYIFIALNLILWHCYSYRFFVQRDLNRLGSFVTTPELTDYARYDKHHMEFSDWLQSGMQEKFDVLTLGDSFSRKSAGNYYQDYIADKWGLKVLNIDVTNNCLESLYLLISSGVIDKCKPDVIILENVVRGLQERLGTFEMQTITSSIGKEIPAEAKRVNPEAMSSGFFVPIMVMVNMQFVSDIFLRITHPEQLSAQVYVAELERELFTNPGQERLLMYYYYDLEYLNEAFNIEMINTNINNAAEILAEKNIKTIFMPCVDKYDLYYPYIKDKRGLPENPFFDEFRKVQSQKYTFIDTKAILNEALERGEKDIYWLSDTHWSWKGQQIVCDEIAKYLVPEKLN